MSYGAAQRSLGIRDDDDDDDDEDLSKMEGRPKTNFSRHLQAVQPGLLKV